MGSPEDHAGRVVLATGDDAGGVAFAAGVERVLAPGSTGPDGDGPALPWVAAAVCAAMLGVHQLPALPGAVWLVPVAIAALLALGSRRTRWLLLVLAACVYTVVSAKHRVADQLPDALTGGDFDVIGWVDGFPTGPPERRTFSFVVEHAADPAVPRKLRLGWYDAPDALEAGESFALTVRLRAPRGLVNPAGFDYEQWLLVQGYGATGYVREGTIHDDVDTPFAQAWLRVRRKAAKRLAAAAPDPEAAALMIALTIGERFGFSDAHWTALRRTGTSHLVAISGMHVGLIAALVFAGVRRVVLRLPSALAARDIETAAVASAVAAGTYAALAGFGLPTQRALVMVLAALAVTVGRRRAGWGNGLAAALLVVLLFDPFAVLAVSFWLSFGAVALLLVLASRHDARGAPETRGQRVRRGAGVLIILQLSVSFGLTPLAAAYFGELSVIAPLVNLVAIPYFSFVLVPLALAALGAAALGLPGAAGVVELAGFAANIAWFGIDAAASVPWASFGVARPGAAVALVGIAAVAAGLPSHPLPGRWLAWLGVLPVLWPATPRLAVGTAEVTVLDVGHGLAVVIETAHHRLLYDAGPAFPSGFDTGADVVVPVLAQQPGRGLDRLVVSHADNDHAGGVDAVLAAYPQANVLKGPDAAALPGRVCQAGERWHWDGVQFELLHPAEGFTPLGNESSCVLKVSGAGGTLLVLGDVERRGERELVKHPRLSADVVVVAHHGSATSSTQALVDAVDARFALVSAGYRNRWNFPRPEVVRRWEASGAKLFSTGDSGALSLTLADGRVEPIAERERRRRYWRVSNVN